MRSICIICNYKYNLEDLSNCIKCKEEVCQECVVFEDGNYYCSECVEKEEEEEEEKRKRKLIR